MRELIQPLPKTYKLLVPFFDTSALVGGGRRRSLLAEK